MVLAAGRSTRILEVTGFAFIYNCRDIKLLLDQSLTSFHKVVVLFAKTHHKEPAPYQLSRAQAAVHQRRTNLAAVDRHSPFLHLPPHVAPRHALLPQPVHQGLLQAPALSLGRKRKVHFCLLRVEISERLVLDRKELPLPFALRAVVAEHPVEQSRESVLLLLYGRGLVRGLESELAVEVADCRVGKVYNVVVDLLCARVKSDRVALALSQFAAVRRGQQGQSGPEGLPSQLPAYEVDSGDDVAELVAAPQLQDALLLLVQFEEVVPLKHCVDELVEGHAFLNAGKPHPHRLFAQEVIHSDVPPHLPQKLQHALVLVEAAVVDNQALEGQSSLSGQPRVQALNLPDQCSSVFIYYLTLKLRSLSLLSARVSDQPRRPTDQKYWAESQLLELDHGDDGDEVADVEGGGGWVVAAVHGRRADALLPEGQHEVWTGEGLAGKLAGKPGVLQDLRDRDECAGELPQHVALIVQQMARGWLLFQITLLGLFNNSGYVLILCGSQDVAKHFGRGSWMGVISLMLILCSALTSLANSTLLLRVPHERRLKAALLVGGVGYALYAIASVQEPQGYFILILAGSVMAGIQQALGESVMIGYLKRFPPNYIVGWASGTGLAGPLPSALYLLFKFVDLTDFAVYFSLLLVLAAYWAVFVRVQASGSEQDLQKARLTSSLDEDEGENRLLSFQSAGLVFRKVGWLILSLFLVYLLEYTILSCFADRANKNNPKDGSFLVRNAYAVLSFCYQIGVFLSRSSLSLLQVRRTYLLTAAQALLAGLWAYIAAEPFAVEVQMALMLVVGLMGGCCYVNTYHEILKSDSLLKDERQLAVNLTGIGNNLGTLLAEVLTVVLSNTVYK